MPTGLRLTRLLSQKWKFLLLLLRTPSQKKHLSRWWRSFSKDYLLNAPCPWITFDAIDFLTGKARPGFKVFEWGSGGSTLFWLKCGASVVSVEHDQAWHALLSQRLPAGAKIDYRLIKPEPDETGNMEISNSPELADYRSRDANWENHNFKRYVTAIDEFPDSYFDVIVVDGRARPSCIRHAAKKLSPNGMLVLDNADRPYYLENLPEQISRLRLHEFIGAGPSLSWFVQTNIYTNL